VDFILVDAEIDAFEELLQHDHRAGRLANMGFELFEIGLDIVSAAICTAAAIMERSFTSDTRRFRRCDRQSTMRALQPAEHVRGKRIRCDRRSAGYKRAVSDVVVG
jgi:hypothetical protein